MVKCILTNILHGTMTSNHNTRSSHPAMFTLLLILLELILFDMCLDYMFDFHILGFICATIETQVFPIVRLEKTDLFKTKTFPP